MAFVSEENRKSLAVLTGDPRYETFRAEAQAILTATDRIPSPSFLGDGVGNFWQDATNPKGVWRRTTLDSYRTATPRWETLLDIDALSRAEGKDWVFKGADCLAPDDTRCLINLSDGGKDAVVVREFDLTAKRFVDGGFSLPEGKHRIEWLDRDTLLVATDFGAGTMTESGYPFIVKTLKRGQTLAQATEVYRGEQSDGGYGVSPAVYRDKDGKVTAVIITRPLDTFRSETWQLVGWSACAPRTSRPCFHPRCAERQARLHRRRRLVAARQGSQGGRPFGRGSGGAASGDGRWGHRHHECFRHDLPAGGASGRG